MTTALILLHTTETNDGTGRTLARTMPAAGTAPHALYEPTTDVEYVLLQPGQKAKSLRNLKGGVETNNRERDGAEGTDVYQIEIVARASQVDSKSAAWYRNLKRYLQRKSAELDVPYTFPLRFPTDAWDAANVRLTDAEWYSPGLRGFIGHCHVPENSHWDPGPLRVAALVDGALTPSTVVGAAPAFNPSGAQEMRLYRTTDTGNFYAVFYAYHKSTAVVRLVKQHITGGDWAWLGEPATELRPITQARIDELVDAD